MFHVDKMAPKVDSLTIFGLVVTFDLKIKSAHLCSQVKESCKFSEIPPNILKYIVFPNFGEVRTDA